MRVEDFECLRGLRHSDNTCSVGWTNVWARGWDYDAIHAARFFCPRGSFTGTTYRRPEFQLNGDIDPEYLGRGAYFDFPMDNGALHLLQALGLIDELMVLRADGGRHRWPKEADR